MKAQGFLLPLIVALCVVACTYLFGLLVTVIVALILIAVLRIDGRRY